MKHYKADQIPACAKCGKPVGMGGYQLDISQMLIDPMAAQQQVGLAMMLGGNLALAGAMGPNGDVLKAVGLMEPSLMVNVSICQSCALTGGTTIGELLVLAETEEEDP